MPNRNTAIVRTLYEAIGRGDIAAVLGAMAPDVEWNLAENFLYAEGSPFIGPDAVLERVFSRAAAEWDKFAHHIARFVADGDIVVAFGRYSAISN